MKMHDTLDELNKSSVGTLMESLQIRYVDFTGESLTAEMPVNKNTIQPFGFLHGGATMALAETVGGALSFITIDNSAYIAVGLEINANHLHSVMEGKVLATATFLHKGNSTHVLDIRVHDLAHRLISVCRLTNKILKK
jgi:1,4-dihydroxy-2-naphthoyl-CoA hydrolase